MPSSLNALFSIQAYVSAEAYAQARNCSPATPVVAETPPSNPEVIHTAFFRDAPPFIPSVFSYRNAPEPQFSVPFPRDVVVHVFAEAARTGKRYSIFRHNDGFNPVTYEVREGSSQRSHTSALGSETYSQAEEDFFGTDFAAHIHPPSQSYLPSQTDLEFMAERARSNPDRRFRHYVFGFLGAEAVFVSLETQWWPEEDRLEFRCRTSDNVPSDVARLLQALVEKL